MKLMIKIKMKNQKVSHEVMIMKKKRAYKIKERIIEIMRLRNALFK